MEYTNLGRTGLSVSRLCLGTMNFGPLTPPDEAHAIMDHAHELGINFFDTANGYGGAPAARSAEQRGPRGRTEEIIGDWFAPGGGRRERTVLATKLYGSMGDWPNDGKLSALNIRRACDASLRGCRPTTSTCTRCTTSTGTPRGTRSGRPWRSWSPRARSSTSARPTSPAGTSPRPTRPAAARHFLGLVSEQSIYNLMTRDIELEVLPAARALRRRRHPVVAAAGRPARRRAAQGARGQAPHRGPGPGGARAQPRADRGVRGPLRRAGRGAGRRRRWPGCCTRPG